MTKQQFKCVYCGTLFKTYLNGRKTVKYCSRKCFGKDKEKTKTRICKHCGNQFEKKRYKQVFCSHNCYSKNLIGKKQPTISKEGRQNISLAKQGKKNPMYGIRGKEHPNWNGGKTDLKYTIRCMCEYKYWRTKVFERDGYKCQECGDIGGYLEAHHIKRFSEILDEYNIKNAEEALDCKELWSIKNGKTLCKKCHDPTKGRRKQL